MQYYIILYSIIQYYTVLFSTLPPIGVEGVAFGVVQSKPFSHFFRNITQEIMPHENPYKFGVIPSVKDPASLDANNLLDIEQVIL